MEPKLPLPFITASYRRYCGTQHSTSLVAVLKTGDDSGEVEEVIEGELFSVRYIDQRGTMLGTAVPAVRGSYEWKRQFCFQLCSQLLKISCISSEKITIQF